MNAFISYLSGLELKRIPQTINHDRAFKSKFFKRYLVEDFYHNAEIILNLFTRRWKFLTGIPIGTLKMQSTKSAELIQ
ncbi:MAG: hypothetical protein QGD88_09655, partial [Anaerolineae bacterium]|nr:hypothetical protein [Anaerolineae bacterium]